MYIDDNKEFVFTELEIIFYIIVPGRSYIQNEIPLDFLYNVTK